MNVEFEKKLSALREEAQREGLPAIHVVLHLLHACYREGTHKDFAKFCCNFVEGTVSLGKPQIAEQQISGNPDAPVRAH